MVSPNIFKTRNNWNVISMRCKKKHNVNESFIRIVANEIERETGINAFNNTEYRGRNYVITRQLVSVMLWRYSGMTEKEIGEIFDKDHATVNHAKKTIQNLYETDMHFREQFNRIEIQVKKYKR